MKYAISFCLAMLVATPAFAIQFQEGTTLAVEKVNMRKETRIDVYTYNGLDEHGHRFVSEKHTMWLHTETGNWVRQENVDGRLTANINATGDFMGGSPGEKWNFSYTRVQKEASNTFRRRVRCRAGEVEGDTYTVRCSDRRSGRPKALIRTIEVDAATGMWRSRQTLNEANRKVSTWKVTTKPVVTRPAQQ